MSKEIICKEAFMKGFPNFKGPVFFGTHNGNLEKCFELKNKGIDFVYIDMPYFDSTRYHFVNNDLEKSYFRVCFNSVFINKIYDVPEDRFNHLNIKIDNWKREGKNIIFFTSSPIVTNFFYSSVKIKELIKKIKKTYPNKNLLISKKTSSRLVNTLIPIKDQVKDCFFTVSITSIACVQSLILGIPSFCHEMSPCFPVSSNIDGDFKKINYSEKRLEWLKTLSYGQFSLKEMAEGLPLFVYKNYFKLI